MKRYLAENEIRFYTINAMQLAMEVGLGGRINTAMETAFFTWQTSFRPRKSCRF